jgi:hypothetical protein
MLGPGLCRPEKGILYVIGRHRPVSFLLHLSLITTSFISTDGLVIIHLIHAFPKIFSRGSHLWRHTTVRAGLEGGKIVVSYGKPALKSQLN